MEHGCAIEQAVGHAEVGETHEEGERAIGEPLDRGAEVAAGRMRGHCRQRRASADACRLAYHHPCGAGFGNTKGNEQAALCVARVLEVDGDSQWHLAKFATVDAKRKRSPS